MCHFPPLFNFFSRTPKCSRSYPCGYTYPRFVINTLKHTKRFTQALLMNTKTRVYILSRLRWSRGSVLAFSTQVRGFKLSRSLRIFKGEKILSTPSFGGEVKPSVPCRRFAACKRSLNGVEVVISAKLRDSILAHSSTFRRWDLSRRGRRGGTWWRKLERLNAGESNGKLPLRICP
jgi:hypothetical protein